MIKTFEKFPEFAYCFRILGLKICRDGNHIKEKPYEGVPI
jgi:hypothetical protein